MNLSDLELTKGICMLIYGDPKVGKSHFLASVCATGRYVLIGSPNGLATYKGAEVKKAFPDFDPSKVRVELIQRDQSPKTPKAWDQLNKICKQLFFNELDSFDGIIVDDNTFIRQQARNVAIKVNGDAGRSTTLDKLGVFHGQPVLEQSDFGREMDMMMSFLDELTYYGRTYGKNIIVAAHEKTFEVDAKKDSKTGITRPALITAAFTGSKERTANSTHFDIVARLKRQGKEASMKVIFQCKSDGLVDAGDRYGVLKMYEENLTWQKVLDKIKAQDAASSIEPERQKKLTA